MLKKLISATIEKISPQLLFLYRLKRRGVYEPETGLLQYLINPAELSLDIGANAGYFAYFILKHTEKLVAFEPNPLMISSLRRVFGNRIEIKETALSDHAGRATLTIPVDSGREISMLASIEPDIPHINGGELLNIEVETRKLDDYPLDRVGFIKIDVEGHELAVLKGGEGLLRRDLPSLLIESEERHKSGAIEAVRTYLNAMGYKGFFLLNNEIKPIEEFDQNTHQNPAMTSDSVTAVNKIYVNNFIFIARENVMNALPGGIGKS